MHIAQTIRRLTCRLGALTLAMTGSVVHAADLEALIQNLGGEDDAKRVTARQLLPREGINAVPPLLKLMERENPEVWRVAKNVLADIGHSVGTPGFEKERRWFTAQLMDVAQSDSPDWTVKHAIRLLGIVAPEGYPIKPMRDLALNSKWRQETLSALEVMGTSESRALLEKLSRAGSVEERVEVIELLRLVSGDIPEELLRDTDPRIRVAAMRGLAHTGAPGLIAPFELAMVAIQQPLYAEAMDAYLNLAEAVAAQEENKDRGIAMFLHVLTTEKATVHRGAALAGLGRFGDESVVPIVIKATREKQGHELEAPALMALGDLSGHAAYTAMLKAYPTVSKEMQLGLLGVFGRSQDPMFREFLVTAAEESDMATQASAKQALKQYALPPGINTAEASHPPEKEESDD